MTDLAEQSDTIATLDGVFDEDQTTDEPEAEEVPQEEPEAKETEEEEVTGETDEESEAEPPAADEEKSVPIAALQDERRKRQELEQELQAYKQKETPQEIEEVDDETYTERANLSREILAEAFPDYEEKEKVFLELATNDPFLRQQVRASKNPAKFAYTKAKEHLEIQELKSLKTSDEWTQFQQWKSDQLKPKKEDPRKASAVSVPDLTKAAAAGSNSTPIEKDEGLDEIMSDAPF